jgi:oxygen-independent coproporphyrinogen-3 oxidase
MLGLYIHVPFCVSKCCYCDFYSLPGRLDSLEAYIEAVVDESRKYRDLKFATLYLGGGTPSLLGAEGLQKLVHGLKQVLDLSALSEATLEANPDSVTTELLESAGCLGINRISLGVQSLWDAELQAAGRIHTAAQAMQAIELARSSLPAGTSQANISADVILGLPGQDWPSLMVTLETLIGLDIPHLSLYCLSLEPHTPLAANPPPDLPSDDEQAGLYENASALLSSRGFIHYEISNFALPGFECRHNLNYWWGGEYVGLGPAAASHLAGRRFKNRADLDAYIQNPRDQTLEVEELPPREKAAEEAMLRLRLLQEGLDADALARRYGDENILGLVSRLNQLVGEEKLTRNGAQYRLVPACALVSNPILAQVLGD